jgi:hypothetical protein
MTQAIEGILSDRWKLPMRCSSIRSSDASVASRIWALKQRTCPSDERRIDLAVKRLWITEHRVEEKQRPTCFHRTRASFPASVSAPAQYGTGIAALAVTLVEGQCRGASFVLDMISTKLAPSEGASV